MKEVYFIKYYEDDLEWTDTACFTTYNYAEEYLFNNYYEKKVDSHGFKYYEHPNDDNIDSTATIYKKNVLR